MDKHSLTVLVQAFRMRAALWHGSHLCVGFLLFYAPWSECKNDPTATHNSLPKRGVVYGPSAMPGQWSYIQAIGPLTVRQQSWLERDQWYRTSH